MKLLLENIADILQIVFAAVFNFFDLFDVHLVSSLLLCLCSWHPVVSFSKVLFKVLICGLPWSFVRTHLLHVLGCLGHSCLVDLDDFALLWDFGALDIGESGLEVLDVRELEDVLGKEVLVISEDRVIQGWDAALVTGESRVIPGWDEVLVAGLIPGWDEVLKASYWLLGILLSVVLFVLLSPCRLGLFLLVPRSLTLGELISSLSMCWHAWYPSLVPMCLGVFMGLWSFKDVRWPRIRLTVAVRVGVTGKGLGSGQVVQLGKGWGMQLSALGAIGWGVGLRVYSGCRAWGTLLTGSDIGTQLGLGDGLGVWVSFGVMSLLKCTDLLPCSCDIVCPGPWACSSRVSRPCQWLCWECRTFHWWGKGRGLPDLGLAGIRVWHCGNSWSSFFVIAFLKLGSFWLVPCQLVWRVCWGDGWSSCVEFPVGVHLGSDRCWSQV